MFLITLGIPNSALTSSGRKKTLLLEAASSSMGTTSAIKVLKANATITVKTNILHLYSRNVVVWDGL
jgi:hypothetical protein